MRQRLCDQCAQTNIRLLKQKRIMQLTVQQK